ncbi:MAG: peptidase C39 family protein [Vulcanimicrobiaceae bacterium]
MLKLVAPAPATVRIEIEPATEAVVSWNSRAAEGALELRIERCDGARSGWLPYVRWSALGRRSLSGADEVAKVELDTLRSPSVFAALEVRADATLDALAVSVPPASAARAGNARDLLVDVAPRSQYLAGHPLERGWCSPASLAMLLAHWGHDLPTEEVAARVRDDAYGGTGNWTFNVALASAFGLRAAVVHLRDLEQAAAFVSVGVPLALSFSWRAGELPGAPLEHTDGHLAVLVGFDVQGDPILNDPAQPALRVRYPHDAFERAWLGHGGIAYALAPPERADLAALARA